MTVQIKETKMRNIIFALIFLSLNANSAFIYIPPEVKARAQQETAEREEQRRAELAARKKESPEEYKARRDKFKQDKDAQYKTRIYADAKKLSIYFDEDTDFEKLKKAVQKQKHTNYLEQLKRKAKKIGVSGYYNYDDIDSLKAAITSREKEISAERNARFEQRQKERQFEVRDERPRGYNGYSGLQTENTSYGFRRAERGMTESEADYYSTK